MTRFGAGRYITPMAKALHAIVGTEKEPAVAQMLADGLSLREIARRIGITDHKVIKRYSVSLEYMVMVANLRSLKVKLGPNAPSSDAPDAPQSIPTAKPRLIEASVKRTIPAAPPALDSDEAFDDPVLDMNDIRKRLTKAIRPWLRDGMLTPAVASATSAALGIARFELEAATLRGATDGRPQLEAENERLQELLLSAKGRQHASPD